MTKGRLEAFSDGVIAIVITIMVLEIKAPPGNQLIDLKPLIPYILSYVLSFLYISIYWNNHHHLLHAAEKIDGKILWTNLYLLFWLSLIPFVTSWMGEHYFTGATVMTYGFVLLMAAIAYNLLQQQIVALNGKNSLLAKAIGRDLKGKASIVLYAAAIGVAFFNEWVATTMYYLVAIIWLIPDRRIERVLKD
jgi:uncharacterized membrane protein